MQVSQTEKYSPRSPSFMCCCSSLLALFGCLPPVLTSHPWPRCWLTSFALFFCRNETVGLPRHAGLRPLCFMTACWDAACLWSVSLVRLRLHQIRHCGENVMFPNHLSVEPLCVLVATVVDASGNYFCRTLVWHPKLSPAQLYVTAVRVTLRLPVTCLGIWHRHNTVNYRTRLSC